MNIRVIIPENKLITAVKPEITLSRLSNIACEGQTALSLYHSKGYFCRQSYEIFKKSYIEYSRSCISRKGYTMKVEYIKSGMSVIALTALSCLLTAVDCLFVGKCINCPVLLLNCQPLPNERGNYYESRN